MGVVSYRFLRIIWLGAFQSVVMNSSLSDFRKVYKDLFD